jgi:hypothetical protein
MLNNVISKIRLMVKDARQNLPAESANVIEGVYGEIVELNNFLNKKLSTIENDKDLDDTAKNYARRKVFEKTGRKLEVLKNKRNYSSKLKALEAKLPEDPVPEDAVLKFLREKEIRDRLVGMTERQILTHFGESLFDGSKPQIIDAILNAPPGFEILAEEDLERLRAVRKKKMRPEMAVELEHLRKLNDSISQMFRRVKKELDTLRKKELPAELIEKGQRPPA